MYFSVWKNTIWIAFEPIKNACDACFCFFRPHVNLLKFRLKNSVGSWYLIVGCLNPTDNRNSNRIGVQLISRVNKITLLISKNVNRNNSNNSNY